MKKIVIMLLIASLSSCLNSQSLVINKLKSDSLSLGVYIDLCENYKHNKKEVFNKYLKLYNKGIPLVRLFSHDVLSNYFSKKNCSKFSYFEMVSDDFNLINDERKYEYFEKYIKDYYIVPPTD